MKSHILLKGSDIYDAHNVESKEHDNQSPDLSEDPSIGDKILAQKSYCCAHSYEDDAEAKDKHEGVEEYKRPHLLRPMFSGEFLKGYSTYKGYIGWDKRKYTGREE